MRILIDTNILLFLIMDKELLSKYVKRITGDYGNELYISSESVREVMDLLSAGRIKPRALKSAADVIGFIENETPFVIKYIKKEHFMTYSALPVHKDHRDPRDRMIIAHAITEKLALVSSDTKFSRYERYGLNLIHNKY